MDYYFVYVFFSKRSSNKLLTLRLPIALTNAHVVEGGTLEHIFAQYTRVNQKKNPQEPWKGGHLSLGGGERGGDH